MNVAPSALAQKRAEEEASRAKLLLESVLRSLSEGVVAADTNGKFLFWNAAAERIVGIGITDEPSEKWPEHYGVFREDGVTPVTLADSGLARAMRGEFVKDEIQCLKRPDLPPEGRWVSVTAAPLVDENGQRLGGVASFVDITAQRSREAEVRLLSQELRTQVDRLGEVNDELRTFAYTVSHDLRAPLRAIQGFANALLEDYANALPAEGRQFTKRVSDAAVRMDGLIQDLLEYSRLSQAEFELGDVNLATVIEAAREHVASELAAARVELALDAGRSPRVRGHERTLIHIVANLLSNAAKFVPQGVSPQVRITAERRGQQVRLWVEDNGIGIAVEHQDRIFRVFERLHGRERYEGTGIGLAIVRKGMQRLGGSTGVDSTLGAGSRFWIELPSAEVTS